MQHVLFFQISLRAVICDLPAKNMVRQTRGHTGRSACDKCCIHGVRRDHTMTFCGDPGESRTDESFRNMQDDDHHVGVSPFIDLPIDMIATFPIDSMRCVYLSLNFFK